MSLSDKRRLSRHLSASYHALNSGQQLPRVIFFFFQKTHQRHSIWDDIWPLGVNSGGAFCFAAIV